MKNKNLVVGLFFLAGLVLLTSGMFIIGDRRQAFSKHVEYYTEFTNLAGLTNGAKVRVAGMDAGEVLAIGVPDSPQARFRVKLKVNETLRGLVRTDSLATIGTEGVVGDTFLSVRAGSRRAPAAAALSTLPSNEPLELSAILDQGTGLLNDVDGAVKQLSGKIDTALDGASTTMSNVNDVVVGLKKGRGTVGMLLTDPALANRFSRIASNVDDVTGGLKDGRGPAGMLLRDEALAAQVRHTVASADEATSSLRHASEQADGLISDLQNRQIVRNVDETITRVKSAAANIDDGTRQLTQIIGEVAQPDARGMSAGANIRESLANANTATANIADDTEALKHNFLLRGFFKKRGYYNVAKISPDTYRQDRLFTSPNNYRAWMTAGELFRKSPQGSEELSAEGKQLIGKALMQYGDTPVAAPVVIEGYWSGDSSVDRLALSRSRAILVREYLERRFQLESGNLGVVAMKDLPPAGLGHATWDGICIVIPRRPL
jgi:phospholipid/cholesterol/gamma-HCH transport system substrate-binding protein